MELALIVSERMDTRRLLRQFLQFSNSFEQVASTKAFDEALWHLVETPQYNFVFIGSEFESEATASFITSARKGETKKSKKKFILVFREGEQNPEKVAQSMMLGFHAFLCEPFSADAIAEITQLAGKVSQQQTALRLKAATGILLSDVCEDSDDEEDASSKETDLWEQSKKSCEYYNKVTSESVTLAASKLQALPPSDRVEGLNALRKRVNSVSKRMRMFFKRGGAVPAKKGARKRRR